MRPTMSVMPLLLTLNSTLPSASARTTPTGLLMPSTDKSAAVSSTFTSDTSSIVIQFWFFGL